MRRRSIVVNLAVLASAVSMTALGTGVAVATPPSGVVAFTDLARAQAVEGLSIPIKPGNALVSGAYSLAPGGQTGWRRLPGAAILAVTKGGMTVRRADGCSTKDYTVGQASVIPAGEYLIQIDGKSPSGTAQQIVAFKVGS